jgi:hypothetical protein
MTAWKRACDTANSCVEVCRQGSIVLVRDSKDPGVYQAWTADEWRGLLGCVKVGWRPEGVRDLVDGCVEVGLERHDDRLTFDADEWKAFEDDVKDDRFEIDKLPEFGSSSSRRGVAEEDGEGSGGVAGPDQAATGAGVPSSPPAPVAAHEPLVDAAPSEDLVAEIPSGGAASADGSGLRPSPATGAVGVRAPGSTVPVAAELGSLDDELDTLISPDSCGCTEMVADAACTEHGMKAFLRALLSIEDTPADRLAGRGSLLPASTPDDPRSGGQPGPYVAEITWSEDPSLGEPQGSPVGRPVDVSTDEVDLSSAVQPGSDAAGTGTSPDPVPAAQPRMWSLAEEPGADVTAVKDAEASVWNRAAEYHCRACNRWSPDWDPDVEIEWSPLLVEYGPLTDATPAVAPLVSPDGAQ